MKRKLLFLMTMLISAFAWNAKAQTDVTSTYLTNADFEGEYSVYSYPQSGRAIYQPTGWTVTYTNGDANDLTALNNGCLQWSNFNTQPQLSTGGTNTYWIRFRWGSNEYLKLSQTVTLLAGQYVLSADAIKIGGSSAKATIFADNHSTTVTASTPSSWTNYQVEFQLAEAKSVTLGFDLKQNTAEQSIAAFDNFTLTYTAVVIKDALEEALDYATRINTELSSSDLASAISTAQGVYDSTTASQDDVNNAVTSLKSATATAIADSGLTDITFVFKNGDFSSTDGWEPVVSPQYYDYGNGLIGSVLANNSSKYVASTIDASHLDTDYYLGNECRWSTNYSSFTQSVLILPAGNYMLSYDVENTNGSTTSASYENRFFVKVGDTTIADESTEWMSGRSAWTTHTIYFTLSAPSEITLSLGYGSGSNNFGQANTPVLYTSHLALNIINDSELLAAAKAAWEAALAEAEAARDNADYANVAGEERANLLAEIAKAEPTTVEGYEAATQDLNDVKDAFIAAKANYDELAAEIAYAQSLGVSTTAAEAVQADPTTTADGAIVAMQDLKVTEYNTLKNGDYTYDATPMMGEWTSNSFGDGTASGQHWDGSNTQYFDHWSGSSMDMSLTQTVNLPAGEYMFMAAGRGATNATLSLTVNGTTVDYKMKGDVGYGIDTSGATNFDATGTYANTNGRGWEWRYVTFYLSDPTDVTFTFDSHLNGGSWSSVGKEMYLLAKPNADILKDVLASVLTQANDMELYTNVGDEAFQIPASVNTDFAQAIDDAQAVYDDPTATQADVEAATTALEDAITAFENPELNEPDATKKYAIKVAGNEHAQFDHAIVASLGDTGQNNPTGYAFKALYSANDALAQAFTFTKVSGNDYYISITMPAGEVYLTNGTKNGSAAGWKEYQIQGTTDITKAMAFRIKASATTDGVFNIINPATETSVDVQDGGNVYTENGNVEFTLVVASQASVDLAIASDVKYATRIFPFVPTLPSGVVAYTCSEEEGGTLNLVEATTPEANVPYILFADEGVASTSQSGWGLGIDETTTGGLLVGNYADENLIVPVNAYVLQKNDDKVAFFKVTEDVYEQVYVGKYRCYLAADGNGAKFINLDVNNATAIEAIEALTSGNAEIYNAAGVRVNSLERGLNIIRTADGKVKKVLVK